MKSESDGRDGNSASNDASTRQKESLLLISITYLAASLYWIGTLVLIFYIALSCRLISNLEADNMTVLLQSPSTLYMMLLVTALALVKDNMFVRVNAPNPVMFLSTSGSTPQKPSLWSLCCTLFITLSLVTLHSKGALTKIVDAASSTDFLTTSDIVYSTVETIMEELLQEEVVSSNFRSAIHHAENGRKDLLGESGYIAFCGNGNNIFLPSRRGESVPLYLKYSKKHQLQVYEGQLSFKKLGPPIKYLYKVITMFFPREIEPKNARLIWSSTVQSPSTKFQFKFDVGDLLRIEKQRENESAKKPYKLIYSDRRFDVANSCKDIQSI